MSDGRISHLCRNGASSAHAHDRVPIEIACASKGGALARSLWRPYVGLCNDAAAFTSD
jgi:hypothetical protein